ncbi:hypothetical protein GGTG_04664 [Gaeumannomyces tritici R3-111a-1]|uniref:FHA domain-containing protein n=1 Tax=Gaeumannomyces tritici (strain R3-111a-1) TaxID=644352 RepID=J3NTR4_GAET3|nr:hypothetical protein GGTG_04664 [Gaeumannomyces tritici R3-111a-1]EJT79579.1 hypothetical protein GGTG_04664 [Gaeumannomyces tritici R3-111a-1]
MDSTDLDDVILFLLPHKGEGFEGAAFATSMPENKSRVVEARHNNNMAKPHSSIVTPRHEREGTELPEEYGLLENTDCLVLRFSHGARTSIGVVGGRAGHVDLVFQNIPGRQARSHLAFTLDETNMPIARNLGSTGGTKVTYNGEPGERLIAKGTHTPILNITDLLQFKVIVPHRDFASPGYIEKVDKFRLGTADRDRGRRDEDGLFEASSRGGGSFRKSQWSNRGLDDDDDDGKEGTLSLPFSRRTRRKYERMGAHGHGVCPLRSTRPSGASGNACRHPDSCPTANRSRPTKTT